MIDPAIERDQIARVTKLRESRDNISVATRLEALKEVAAGSENTVPAILECVRVRATEGEIIAALKEVFGVHRETPVF